MKLLGHAIFLMLQLSVCGQNQKRSIKKIKQLLDNYTKQNESSDSEDNKIEMQQALKALQVCDSKYFSVLIDDSWMLCTIASG